jgi:preprotein translocase subunit YajC
MAFAALLVTMHGAFVLATTTAKTTSKTSPDFYIFIVLLFAVYFLWLRPQRKKLRATQQQRSAPDIGDDVVTAAGIIGRVVSVEGDRAEVEVAPGQYLTILRSALGRRLDPIIPGSADDDMDLADHDHDEHDGHDHDHDGHDHGADEVDDTPPQRRWWPGEAKDDDSPEGSN